jgi:hypothetical protein
MKFDIVGFLYLGSVYLLKSSFLLKNKFWKSELQESELFSDIWLCNEK